MLLPCSVQSNEAAHSALFRLSVVPLPEVLVKIVWGLIAKTCRLPLKSAPQRRTAHRIPFLGWYTPWCEISFFPSDRSAWCSSMHSAHHLLMTSLRKLVYSRWNFSFLSNLLLDPRLAAWLLGSTLIVKQRDIFFLKGKFRAIMTILKFDWICHDFHGLYIIF